MGGYVRGPHDSIQAALALRAGELLVQYDDLAEKLEPRERREATLAICVLQLLLTNCSELIRTLTKIERSPLRMGIEDAFTWGLDPSFVRRNDFPQRLTLEKVVGHLRDALSHPTNMQSSEPPGTGYTTTDDADGLVTAFRFVDSPWVKDGALHRLRKYDDEAAAAKAIQDFKGNRHTPELTTGRQDGAHVVMCEGRIFTPIFEMGIPLANMKRFARALANYVAQPVDPAWDGDHLVDLVA